MSKTGSRAFAAFVASFLVVSVGAAQDRLPQLGQTDNPIPMAAWKAFRDRVLLPGKCPDYDDAVDDGKSREEIDDAMNACWLDFIAPKS